MLDPVYSSDLGQLYNGDCLEVMRSMPDESVDVIFADPPFNLKKMYGDHYDDDLSETEYLDWSHQWIKEGARLLSSGGSFWLYNIPEWNVENASYMRSLGLRFRHWVAIKIAFGLPIQGKLYPAHYSLLYFTNGKPRTFTRPRTPIEVCRHCGKDVKDYGGHRNKMHPDGVNLMDVWDDIPPVRHRGTKNREANELSEKLLERILTISSKPGDMVFDPFMGAGTTAAVAERMHRRWAGTELGNCEPIVNRLTGIKNAPLPPDNGDAGKARTKKQEAKAAS